MDTGAAAVVTERATADDPPVTTKPTPTDPPVRPVEDPIHEGAERGPIFWTTLICTAAAVFGHAVLWIAYSLEWNANDVDVPWQPVTGVSLVIVSIVSFGGFYLACRRARIAIAASFLLTFLVTLSFAITIEAVAGSFQGDAENIFHDFRYIVTIIIGFYFGSEAAVSVAKVIGVSRTAAGDPQSVQRADRDLVSPAPSH